jgi:hypothetical protein
MICRIHLTRALRMVVMACVSLSPIFGQNDDVQDSVAATARKTREEKSASGHVSAKKVLNDENAPKANLVRKSQVYWEANPPATLSIFVPKSTQLSTEGYEIPLEKSSVYVPLAYTTWTGDLNSAAERFLRIVLTRGAFSEGPVKITSKEQTTISGHSARLIHVSFTHHGVGQDGTVIFINVPELIVGFGCIYRSVDWAVAQPICDEIINSAEVFVLSNRRWVENRH